MTEAVPMMSEQVWILRNKVNPFPVSADMTWDGQTFALTLNAMAAEAFNGWVEEELGQTDIKERLRSGEKIPVFAVQKGGFEMAWPKLYFGSMFEVTPTGGRKWLISIDYPSGGAITQTMSLVSGRKKGKLWKARWSPERTGRVVRLPGRLVRAACSGGIPASGRAARRTVSSMGAAAALESIRARAVRARTEAMHRWEVAVGSPARLTMDVAAAAFARAGRLTVNFHPDRIDALGRSVAAGLLADGRYRSQWATGISNGTRSAFVGGDRHRFEQVHFDRAYDDGSSVDGSSVDGSLVDGRPIYGALDLFGDAHGGSPRFGSSYVVLDDAMRDRTTLSVGDSSSAPADVGTFDAPWSVLAGLAEQAVAGVLLGRGLGIDALAGLLVPWRTPAAGVAARELDGYLEAQVHGGVDLRADVVEIVLDPSFGGTEVERDIRSAADRYGFALAWHVGSQLVAADVPSDFRGPTMPALAARLAGPDGIVDAARIGAAATGPLGPPLPGGDPPESDAQQRKYLWHTLLAFGHDAVA